MLRGRGGVVNQELATPILGQRPSFLFSFLSLWGLGELRGNGNSTHWHPQITHYFIGDWAHAPLNASLECYILQRYIAPGIHLDDILYEIQTEH